MVLVVMQPIPNLRIVGVRMWRNAIIVGSVPIIFLVGSCASGVISNSVSSNASSGMVCRTHPPLACFVAAPLMPRPSPYVCDGRIHARYHRRLGIYAGSDLGWQASPDSENHSRPWFTWRRLFLTIFVIMAIAGAIWLLRSRLIAHWREYRTGFTRDLYHAMDADKQGGVSFMEFYSGLLLFCLKVPGPIDMQVPSIESARKMFDFADKDHNGKMVFAEFDEAIWMLVSSVGVHIAVRTVAKVLVAPFFAIRVTNFLKRRSSLARRVLKDVYVVIVITIFSCKFIAAPLVKLLMLWVDGPNSSF